jgi:hypothetical protein
MRSESAFAAATFVAFAVFALVWTWPLAPIAETAYVLPSADPTLLSMSDAMLTSWMLAWTSHALGTAPLGLYHANIFHPLPWTFAFSENLIAGALLVAPVHLVSGNPVLDHNALVVASFVLGALGTALLVRRLGGAPPAAWLAGALVAFAPFRFASMGHVQANSTHWMPFALLALERCWRTGRGAVLVAFTVLLVTLSSVYYAYFFFAALAVLVPAHWALGAPAAPGGRRRVVAGIVAAGVITGAVLFPYSIARDVYALSRASGETWIFSARLAGYLGAVADPLAYVVGRYVAPTHPVPLVGLGTILLLAVGLVAGAPAAAGGRRVTTLYALTAAWLALVSLGPLIQWSGGLDPSVPGPWNVLAVVVPGFSALRVPMRASTIATLGIAVVAGLGAHALWRRARRPLARAALLLLFVVVGVLESWRPPLHVAKVPWADGAPPVYRWLAAQPGRDAVVELPIGIPQVDSPYMVMSAAHWRPLVNGYSGFTPTMSFFRGVLFLFPNPDAIRLLHEIGVRWVVVHPDKLPPGTAGMCRIDPARIAPHAAVAYSDPRTCVFEIRSAPPAPPRPRDRDVTLAGATVTTSSGGDARAAVDGRLDTHWTEAVDAATESWIQLDLPAASTVARLLVDLGPHFGEYMRQWRIDTSLDGATWTTATREITATPPLAGLRTDPHRLTQELRLSAPTAARHLRLVRMAADAKRPAFDLWANWTQWGVHELHVREVEPDA